MGEWGRILPDPSLHGLMWPIYVHINNCGEMGGDCAAEMCASPGCMRLNVRSLGDIWFGEEDRGFGTLELADGTVHGGFESSRSEGDRV